MSWSWVGISTLESSGGGDMTLAEPAGVTVGDLLTVDIGFENNDPFTAPAGSSWIPCGSDINATANRPSSQRWHIIRGASAPDLTWTRTGGNSASGRVRAYRATGTISYIGEVSGPIPGSGTTTFSISGLTTTGANDLLVASAVGNSSVAISNFNATDPGTGSGTSVDTSTNVTAGTWLLRYSDNRAVSSSHYISGADSLRATAGATGNLTATSPSNSYASLAIAAFTESGGGSGDTIDTTEIAAGTVYEGSSGSATVTISGSHTGATDDIEAQIELAGGGVVVAWQTLQSAVAAGAFSGNVTVPAGGMYVGRTRKASEILVSNVQSNAWGVGLHIGYFGQSHAEDFYANGTGTANDRAFTHNGTNFVAMGTTGAGQCAAANALIAAFDCPVVFIGTGVSGTAISYWWSGGKTANYDTWEAKVTAAGGELSAFMPWLGDANAQAGTSKAAFKTELDAVLAQIRTDYGAGLPVVIAQLGRKSGATDSTWHAIRQAHVDAGNDANNYLFTYLDQPTSDGQHLTDAGHEVAGERLAQCVAEAYGEAAYSRGPVNASATYSGAVVDVALTHDTGTDFTPTSGITGYRVLDGASPATISSAVRQAGDLVRLTCSATLTGPVTVQYGYGADPDYSDPLLDNTALALPLQSTDADIVASASASAVTSDLALAWEIYTSASSDLGLSWSIVNSVTSDLALAWEIYTSASSDLGLTFDIQNAASSDLGLSWNIFNSAIQDQSLEWQIYASASSDLALSFDIQGSVSSDLALVWDIEEAGTVTSDLALSWNLLNAAVSDLPLSWDILDVGTVVKDLALVYQIQASVESDLALSWNMLAAVSQDLPLAWEIYGNASSNLALSWDMLAAVNSDLALTWSMAGAVSNDLALAWQILAQSMSPITFTLTPLYDVDPDPTVLANGGLEIVLTPL